LLTQAAELVASPQIRNQGTLGGNVSQDALLVLPRGMALLPRGRKYLLCKYKWAESGQFSP
jgi:CO/xanthine dehydrogenase FAD-binding subunit